jgi:SAM-dependent methyltransferase
MDTETLTRRAQAPKLPRAKLPAHRFVRENCPLVGEFWYELGELQFRFLVEQGLRPEHVFLDIGCGPLRAGVRLIPYLNPGNYLGMDINEALLVHGRDVEIGPTLFALKIPELAASDHFEFNKFSKRPDFAIAQSLFTHLTMDDIDECLRNLRAFAKSGTAFFVTFAERAQPIVNPTESHPRVGFKYTSPEMAAAGKRSGWAMEYIGDWNHPRGQRMIKYSPA